MEILTSTEFLKAFNTLTEARSNLKILEQQVKDGKISGPDAPSQDDIDKVKKELDDLMNLLMAIRPSDDDPNFEMIEQKSLSILSTTEAYSKLVTALLEVQARLAEMEKEYRERAKQNKEFAELMDKAEDIKKNLKFLLDISNGKKDMDNYYIKKDISQADDFNKFMFQNFGLDIKIRPSLNTIV
jgi:hypothetical protein